MIKNNTNTWIHFTNDIFRFAEGRNLMKVKKNKPEMFTDEGLFVYKFTYDFPIDERRAGWGGREPVFIQCDAKYVELIQSDPIGNDETRDEYMIRVKNFDKCTIWFES